LNVRKLTFLVILSTYHRYCPENYIKIGLQLTLKICFENFEKNYRFLKKSGKNSDETAEEKFFFYLHFMNP
jgi:hypothetical protein